MYAQELTARGLSSASASSSPDAEDGSKGRHEPGKLTLHEPIECVVSAWDEADDQMDDLLDRPTRPSWSTASRTSASSSPPAAA